MNGINLLILIIPRETDDEYLRFLRDMDLSALFGFPCWSPRCRPLPK